MCDVAREAGDELIQELQAPGLDEDGSMPLLLNLGGIMLAGTVTMYAQKALWRTRRGRWIRRAGGGAPGH